MPNRDLWRVAPCRSKERSVSSSVSAGGAVLRTALFLQLPIASYNDKIDVNGYEYEVSQGVQCTLFEFKPLLIVEVTLGNTRKISEISLQMEL